MKTRSKTLLTFSLFCLLPLVLVSALSFVFNLNSVASRLSTELQNDIETMSSEFRSLRTDRERELQALANSIAIRNTMRAAHLEGVSSSKESSPVQPPNALLGEWIGSVEESEVKRAIRPLFANQGRNQRFYSAIAAFGANKQLLFVGEAPSGPEDDLIFRTVDSLPDQIRPDDSVWNASDSTPICSVIKKSTFGSTLRCSVPIFASREQSRGALVADVRLDAMVGAVARRSESLASTNGNPTPSIIVMAVDDAGGIVYHTNGALKHLSAPSVMPHFSPIAEAMVAGQKGVGTYRSPEADSWVTAYAPLMPAKLSLAEAANYSIASRSTKRYGWLGIILALIIGTVATLWLSNYHLRQSQSIDVVKRGVGAIVEGELDHEINLRSSDNLRSLADNVGLLSKQMREQLAHEAETRQFQSFVRLSAILTHDLKNSIEALSLTVSNMERHFENADFRADAMKTLRGATENLRALVTRLSNPVSTLSGEHKRPQPFDLVPMLRRVISMTAAQAKETHETKVNLPESLVVSMDAERMEKVVENLIINALEAMGEKKGTLTIEAGQTEDKKSFFSVSDTGEGISQRFIDEKLFHPFATTKRRGVGLGLYTCREVVRAHGGTINVVSEQGVGTTFRVVLPSAAFDTSGKISSTKPQR